MSTFIPAGRTSLVNKGKVAFQIQTEYAFRPYPRLTTTISNCGQVLHKIEKKLKHPIQNVEEQTLSEIAIQKQHREVIDIIQNGTNTPQRSQEQAIEEDKTIIGYEKQPEIRLDTVKMDETCLTLHERLEMVPGVVFVIEIDASGNFLSKQVGEQFKKKYSFIFKNLRELFQVFMSFSIGITSQDKGVYEIERNRLYLISDGELYYIIDINSADKISNYEKAFKSLL